MSDSATGMRIRKGYRPGAIGRVVELHGRYYSKYWNFGLFFETKVARELSEFMDRYDDGRVFEKLQRRACHQASIDSTG